MRTRSSGLAILAATALAAAFPGAALALTPALPDPTTQGVTADGWPLLSAPAHQPGSTTSWSACTDGGCSVVADGPSYEPGPTPAGTTFAAVTTTADGRTIRARTRTWNGRLEPVAAPSLGGEPRIGRHVDPRPGAWSGGWGDESSLVGVRACPTAAGVDCVSMSSGGLQPDSGPVLVGPAYAGWYVGAYEVRIGALTAFPAVALVFPFGEVSGHRAPTPGGRVVAGPLVGPVPAARAGTPPSVGGTLAVGRTVTPRAGTWPDAPADGRIASALRACPTRRDTAECVLLNDLSPTGSSSGPAPGAELAAANASVVLGERLLGWYVGAVDRHSRAGTGDAPLPDRRPGVVPPPGPIVVHGPLSAAPVRLGFTPRAAVVRRIARTPRTLRLGTVRCAGRCVARVTLRWGGIAVVRRVVADGGSAPVTLRRSRLRRARSVRVLVRFDDHPAVVRRTVRIG